MHHPSQKNTETQFQSGLVNLGNTCFMNSTLQCLLNTQQLFSHTNEKCQTFCFYCELIALKHQASSQKVARPNVFAQNLRRLSRSFRLGQQEDAHEFFRLFLDKVCHTEGKPNSLIIDETFSLMMYSQITCQSCQYKSQIQEKYLDLSLEINGCDNVFDSMKNFFQVEILQGQNKYRCSQCNKLVVAKKQFLIKEAPQHFVIHLKRFTNFNQKIHKKINYPSFLDLEKYTANKTSNKYELYGVLIHQGSSSYSGHYYSYIKKGNQWLLMDDASTSRVQEQEAMRQNPYILFYRKTGQEKEKPQQHYQVTNAQLDKKKIALQQEIKNNQQKIQEQKTIQEQKIIQEQKMQEQRVKEQKAQEQKIQEEKNQEKMKLERKRAQLLLQQQQTPLLNLTNGLVKAQILKKPEETKELRSQSEDNKTKQLNQSQISLRSYDKIKLKNSILTRRTNFYKLQQFNQVLRKKVKLDTPIMV